VDDAKRTTGAALDATRKGADTAIDATKDAADKTKEIAGKTADKTREVVGEVAQKSQQVAAATGETVTDGWITTKVKAKFADEKLLEGSDIHVETNDRVITLGGTVPSRAAREQAVSIASWTEGVTRVVNHLVVKSSADPPWRPCCAPQANQQDARQPTATVNGGFGLSSLGGSRIGTGGGSSVGVSGASSLLGSSGCPFSLSFSSGCGVLFALVTPTSTSLPTVTRKGSPCRIVSGSDSKKDGCPHMRKGTFASGRLNAGETFQFRPAIDRRRPRD